jgi:hypothetical protein
LFLTMLNRAYRNTRRAGQFGPTKVSAISAWLRFEDGTVTGSGFSSVPDKLASNPATQGTDAARPARVLAANGLVRADFNGNDFLSWPAAAGNNTTTYAGLATWLEFDSIADGTTGIFGCIPGATNRVEVCKNNADLFINVYHSQFVARRATLPNAFTAGTKVFLTWEQAGDGATDADKCVVTLDGTVRTLTFTNDSGTPNAMPVAMVSTTGAFAVGARRASDGLGPMAGFLGPNIWLFGSKMAGATQGLLTPAARAALREFERPT